MWLRFQSNYALNLNLRQRSEKQKHRFPVRLRPIFQRHSVSEVFKTLFQELKKRLGAVFQIP